LFKVTHHQGTVKSMMYARYKNVCDSRMFIPIVVYMC